MDPPVIPVHLSDPIPAVAFLPPSILDRDARLLGRLLRHLWSSAGLCHGERLVLGAVFQHMPLIDTGIDLENIIAPDRAEAPFPPTSLSPLAGNIDSTSDRHDSFYDRILALPVEQLKLMAKLLTAALAGARSWGGTQKSASGTSSTPTPLTSLGVSDPIVDYDSLFSTLQIQPFPDMPSAADTNDPCTGSKGKATHRPAYQKRACFDRQAQSCAITGGQSNLQHAHIIPHSIVSLSGPEGTLFWMALAIILGPSLRDAVFSIVGADDNFYNTTNSIALVSGLHGHLDTGQLHLVPEATPEPFDASTTRHLDIRICWLGSLLDLALISTARPPSPDDQVRVLANRRSYTPPVLPTRAVADGDRFRLFTNSPEKHPLPHPLLLGIHTMLWRMIATAGMAETRHARKRRHIDAVDGADSKRARRGSGGTRRARGHRGGSSVRSQGGSKDDSFLGGDEADPSPAGASGAAAVDTSESVEHLHIDINRTDSQLTAPPPVPLNNLQLAWIRFRLQFGAPRHDSRKYHSHSGSSSDETSDCDEDYESDGEEEDEDDEYEPEQEKDEVARWREAVVSRTGEAWKARMRGVVREGLCP